LPKAKLQKTGEVAITDKNVLNFDFENGTSYVYTGISSDEGAGLDAEITITSAQLVEGTMTIAGQQSQRGPSSLHGQVTIDLPIDASLDDIARAMKIAGVRDVRSATEADVDILAENRLLSLFAKKNDPTENVKDQTTRAELLSEIEKEWGVTAQDIVPTVGSHGRVNFLLPDKTVDKMIEVSTTTAFGHDISLHHLLADIVAQEYAKPTGTGNAGKKKTFDGEFTGVTMPEAARVEAAATAVANLVKRGILSTVTRFNEGLQYKGMSSSDDMYTGGADYIFLSPTRATASEYAASRQNTTVTQASLHIDAKNVFNRSDIYANGYDAYGKRIIGTDVIESAKPGGYETMVRHGLDIVQPGNTFFVEGTVRERALEMLAADGITEVNGVALEDFLQTSVNSLEINKRLLKGVSGDVLANQLERVGGNIEAAVEVRDVNSLLSFSGAPYSYHYMPPGTKVIASSYTISARVGDYKDIDDLDGFEMATLPTLYVMHPDKTLYQLEPGDSDLHSPPVLVGHDWMTDILKSVGGEDRAADELDILPMTGKAYLHGYGGSAQSGWSASAIVPTGQEDAGISQDSGQDPKTFASYTEYIESLIKDIKYEQNKEYAKREYAKILGMLLPLYMSNIGGMVDSNGATLRSKIATALLNVRNIVLGEEKDTPIVSSANDTAKLLPVDYDLFVVDGNYVNPLSGDIVLEDIDGEDAGHIRPVYYVGVAPELNGILATGAYVMVETNRPNINQYYLDKGTSLVVDPITHEMQFSSHGIKYKIRALQPSDKKKAQERA
jgi:hypothetical protein